MSEIYIGDGYWRETDEPAARQVARRAIALRKERAMHGYVKMDEWRFGPEKRTLRDLERIDRIRRSLRGAALFVTGIVVGLLSAALLLAGR